jgi:hypothetical protein
MIVYQTSGLHKRIANRRAYKFETPFFKICTHGNRYRGLGRYFRYRIPVVFQRLAHDKLPYIFIETAKFLLNGKKGSGILNGRLDFKSIPNNSRIGYQLLYFAGIIAGNFMRVKIIKELSVVQPFLQNSQPTQPGLGTFEDKKFK